MEEVQLGFKFRPVQSAERKEDRRLACGFCSISCTHTHTHIYTHTHIMYI